MATLKKWNDGIIVEITEDEIENLNKEQSDYKKQEKIRPLTDSEVFMLFAKENVNNLNIDDNTSLQMIRFYPTWKELCDFNEGKGFTAEKAGFKSNVMKSYIKLYSQTLIFNLSGYRELVLLLFLLKL